MDESHNMDSWQLFATKTSILKEDYKAVL